MVNNNGHFCFREVPGASALPLLLFASARAGFSRFAQMGSDLSLYATVRKGQQVGRYTRTVFLAMLLLSGQAYTRKHGQFRCGARSALPQARSRRGALSGLQSWQRPPGYRSLFIWAAEVVVPISVSHVEATYGLVAARRGDVCIERSAAVNVQ